MRKFTMEKQVIPIDPDDRYIIIAKGASEQSSLRLSEDLEKWWNDGAKFFVLTVLEDVEVVLERVEDD